MLKKSNENISLDSNNSVNLKKKRNKIKVKDVIEYIIIVFIIVFNLTMIIKSINKPNTTPSLFGKKAFIIVSGSMIPEIQIGDIVIIDSEANIDVGDIAAFRKENGVIVHRIINKKIENGEIVYKSKGDNNKIEDKSNVLSSEIEGKYIGKIPFVGNILLWISRNIYIIFTIIAILIITVYFIKAHKEKNN